MMLSCSAIGAGILRGCMRKTILPVPCCSLMAGTDGRLTPRDIARISDPNVVSVQNMENIALIYLGAEKTKVQVRSRVKTCMWNRKSPCFEMVAVLFTRKRNAVAQTLRLLHVDAPIVSYT